MADITGPDIMKCSCRFCVKFKKYMEFSQENIYSGRGNAPETFKYVLEKYFKESDGTKKVLDVGTATGYWGKDIEDKGYDVTYMDVLKNPYFNIENREVVIGDAHDIPYPEGTFDYVFMSNVLEHFHSPYIAILEARRVLKNTGKLIMITPYDWSHWIKDLQHTNLLTLEHYEVLFERARFTDISYEVHNTGGDAMIVMIGTKGDWGFDFDRYKRFDITEERDK